MTTTDDKLCRFLIVNEDDICKSELFTDCLELKDVNLIKKYQEVKMKHARILSFLYYVEELLETENKKIPHRTKELEEILNKRGKEHIQSVQNLRSKYDDAISEEFLNMTIKMYATYELRVCTPLELTILKNVFDSLEEMNPLLNADLKELLDEYKELYGYEQEIEYNNELFDKLNDTIEQIKILHEYYIKTLGFDSRYVKNEYVEMIEKLYFVLSNFFNLVCASDEPFSALALVNELEEFEIKKYIETFAVINYAKEYRVRGDGEYLKRFLEFLDDDMINDTYVENISTKDNPEAVEFYETLLQKNSKLLFKYKRNLQNLKKIGLTFSQELDVNDELRKVNDMISEFYIPDTKKDEEASKLILKKMNSNDVMEYVKQLNTLQINKMKKISDKLINISESSIIENENVDENGIRFIDLVYIFEQVDKKVHAVYVDYLSDRLEVKNPTKLKNIIRRERKLELIENSTIHYEELFSHMIDGVDIDNKIVKKNRFYLCNFNPELCIMTIPYPNRSKGTSDKYGRAAIIFNADKQSEIINNNRGASWAYNGNDRNTKERDGKEVKIYNGNSVVINDGAKKLIEVLSKQSEIKEESKNQRKAYLLGHKFDYRKDKIAFAHDGTSGFYNKEKFYGLDDVAWIFDDDIDISKYKAVCYMDSAEELKNFIESL